MSSKKKREILIITGSRGEYGYIKPIYKLMEKSETLEPRIMVTNMHLLPEFGNSQMQFEQDGMEINHRAYMAMAGYTPETMTKSLGVAMLSMVDMFTNKRPDIILLAGDRGEQLVASIVGAHLNIPVAHIQAGELSGNIDGLSRHAIARFTHIHFAANEDASERLIRSGEQEFRVFHVGAPQIDDFVNCPVASYEDVVSTFKLDPDKPFVLLVQHPVTEQTEDAYMQMSTTLEAARRAGHQTVIIYPNNDSGSTAVQECVRKSRSTLFRIERNVARDIYAGLMKYACVLVGNSSSGLLEAPTFELPAVNIGRRQEGRFRGRNVIDVAEHDPDKILEAMEKGMSEDFHATLKGMKNPYGDGKSSERIVEVLENIKLDESLIYKKMAY